MSLSDQIKQPGQIIGGGDGVGGGATTDLADWPAGLSEVELGYVNGVTSAIQTQLDGKAASSHTHAASDLTTGTVALARGGTNADLSATGGTGHVLKQSSVGAAITVGALTASDIPATLNATTFAGAVTLSGNVSSAGASVRNVHGNGNANDYVVGVPSGGSFYFASNGSGHFQVSTTVLYTPSIIRTFYDYDYEIGCGVGNNRALKISGAADATDTTRAACNHLYGKSHATYPGAHQSFAPLDTRAASTAFAVCPVATGDVAEVKIRADLIAGLIVVVGTTGTVYFYDNLVARDAAWVNSSTPAAGEIGIYMSGGVLYCKPGSSWTGGSAIKIATFSQIGKA